ncbi:MAG: DUF2281 domain-containing protein [Lachnospiraceae bacterium]|nr:DUF2281 domain-containing protein [Lachnospiraceae bacterium]
MRLQQQALDVIESLSDDKLSQVIQFAEYLAEKSKIVIPVQNNTVNEDGYVRKPGILKKKMVMSDDFDETPDCFKEYM